MIIFCEQSRENRGLNYLDMKRKDEREEEIENCHFVSKDEKCEKDFFKRYSDTLLYL